MVHKIKDKFTGIASRQMRYVQRMRARKLCTNDGSKLAKTSSWYCAACLDKHRQAEARRRTRIKTLKETVSHA
jgi:hypothetical protein